MLPSLRPSARRASPPSDRSTGAVETEAVPMNKQCWICGVAFLAGSLLNAQDVSQAPPEDPKAVVANRSEQFVELLRRAKAGEGHAQDSVASAYSVAPGGPRDDAEAIRWCLQAAQKGLAAAQNRMGYLYEN